MSCVRTVTVNEDALTFELSDGRSISAPLAWYPRLLHGTPEERSNWRFVGQGTGIHWPVLDEDVSVQNLLSGQASGESPVDADEWRPEELLQVIDSGAKLLNVEFDEDFKKELVRESNDSVYIVQEVCRQACVDENIFVTQQHHAIVGNGSDVRQLVKKVVDEQTGRYIDFITKFSEGFQETRLEMHKWLLFPIIEAEAQKLEEGFTYADLRRQLQEKHPNGKELNLGNLTQALQSAASLQTAKDIKPIILDYDQTSRRLNIVDRGFLIWREHQDQKELFDIAGITLT